MAGVHSPPSTIANPYCKLTYREQHAITLTQIKATVNLNYCLFTTAGLCYVSDLWINNLFVHGDVHR